MNIRKIIQEEVNDFDWVQDTLSYEEILDKRFRLVKHNDGYKFEDMIEEHGYERDTYTSLVMNKPRDLYKIILGVKPKWFGDRDIRKTLQIWKDNRIEGLKKTYPNIRPIRGTGSTGPG
jgi:hypothetical protein